MALSIGVLRALHLHFPVDEYGGMGACNIQHSKCNRVVPNMYGMQIIIYKDQSHLKRVRLCDYTIVYNINIWIANSVAHNAQQQQQHRVQSTLTIFAWAAHPVQILRALVHLLAHRLSRYRLLLWMLWMFYTRTAIMRARACIFILYTYTYRLYTVSTLYLLTCTVQVRAAALRSVNDSIHCARAGALAHDCFLGMHTQ